MIVFCDLVGSTELSSRLDPERFGQVIRRYTAAVRRTIEGDYDGRVIGQEGDGILAVFGAPRAHGDDAERSIRAALSVVEAVRRVSVETAQEIGEALAVRIGVHRGQIYREGEAGAVYGLAVNTAARLQNLAATNEVVISDDVHRLVGDRFDVDARDPAVVKGIDEPLRFCRVVGERAPAPDASTTDRPLVNRADEVERLRDCWRAARDGTGGTAAVTVRGEAGIGKSRLVSTLAAEVRAEGARVVELAGSAFFADVELYPVRRLIEREAGIQGDLERSARLVRLRDELRAKGLEPEESLIPLLAPFIGIEPDAGYVAVEAEARRLAEQIGEAALRYVSACLGEEPSVLLVEDLQWFDAATRRLLEQLPTVLPRCALFMTARPGSEVAASSSVLDLAPLSPSETGQLVDALSATLLLRPEARDSLIARSDGIPLYVEELVVGARVGAGHRRDAEAATPTEAVPDLLYDLLVARLDPAANLLSVASAAAAIGREVDLDLLGAAVELTEEELRAALETLIAQEVLQWNPDEPDQCQFRHELLREVAYELNPPSQRRSVHGRVADRLVRSFAEGAVVDWSVIASHLELAGRPVEAVDAYERASDGARMRGAFSEARRHLGKAIDLAATAMSHDAARDRLEVRLRLQRGYITVSQEGNASTSAVLDYERCMELAASDPAGDEMFKAVIVLWAYHAIRGDLVQARRISEFTLRNIEKREWYRTFNLPAFGMLDAWGGDLRSAGVALEAFDRARIPAYEARFQTEWFSPSEPVHGILVCAAMVAFLTGDRAGADRQFRMARRHAEGFGFPQGPFSAGFALSFEAWTQIESDELDRAEESIARFTELSAEHGFDGWTMVAVTQHTVVAALRAIKNQAEPDELRAHAEALRGMVELWKGLDTRFFLTYYQTVTGVVFAAAGDRAAAHTAFTASLAMGSETGMRFYDAETIRHSAHLELNPAGRVERLREALDLARRQGAALFELRAAADLCEVEGPGSAADLRSSLERFPPGADYPEVSAARRRLGQAG
jgi:class 3 adenylate cyclase